MKKRKINIILKILLIGLVSWFIMFPLLLGNYVLFGKWDWIFNLTLIEWLYFGSLTLLCAFFGFISSIWWKTTILNSFLAGLSRWIFVLISIFPYSIETERLLPLFIIEIPIMIFSYVLGYIIINKFFK